ncbi:methylated-DNA--[protein]-cysteine S-methyltransferase [Aeromonas jandaei]|uniref:Methylated-DNA--protein-cysteine methyltransferase n=1 Tax=Aeromonas jandaei TaxID=650 RepID=A0A7T4ACI8_AERJA|nr:methylated-DNA--[protein]-cysteine S-methyltransferase [Aeromonas jandaei]QQB21404.1 methylated-DNA--[protein]-cysteine S-methyltransferase [Aeromonas jandaei]UCA32221.1 methylated-DNA--[protein]-cysteine S-methyltransferase [Aeromonas jandaei]
MKYSFCDSARGPLLIAIDRDGLRYVEFVRGEQPVTPTAEWQRDDLALAPFVEQFVAYFAGRLQQFDLPLAARGTPFQQAVWRVLCDIPYGETVSYLKIAHAIGNPKSVRAVGAANGRNPLSIIVPCHRVIGRNGELTGYAGGIPIKRWLLELEQRHAPFVLTS